MNDSPLTMSIHLLKLAGILRRVQFGLSGMVDMTCSCRALDIDSDTLMAARSQPNDNWGSVGNGAKHG